MASRPTAPVRYRVIKHYPASLNGENQFKTELELLYYTYRSPPTTAVSVYIFLHTSFQESYKSKFKWIFIPNVKEFPQGAQEILHKAKTCFVRSKWPWSLTTKMLSVNACVLNSWDMVFIGMEHTAIGCRRHRDIQIGKYIKLYCTCLLDQSPGSLGSGMSG